ncbi:MAG: lipopolysaccharide biosynthesis protein [Nitrospirota bacterium]
MAQSSFKKQVLSLTASRFIDYGMQFLVPMMLARVFRPNDYGQYMLLWLVVNTALTVTTLHMPQSLLYFLPHSRTETEKVRHILNTILFLIMTGLLASCIVNPWVPLLPERFVVAGEHAWVVPALVFLWTVSQLTDIVPTAEERIGWQAFAVISLSAIRGLLITGIAWYFQDIGLVFTGLVAFATIKIGVFLVYLLTYHPLVNWGIDRKLLCSQLDYSIPFGIGAGLFMLRIQADQWIVAVLFSAGEFSLFVIGAYLGPLLTVIRESVNSVLLPKLSRLQAEGDREAVIELSRTSNIHMAFILFPLLVWFFIFSGDVIEVVFSSVYRDASTVMRIYILSYLTMTFEVNNLFRVLGGGRYSIYLSLGLLVPAVSTSFWGGITYGLWGAALGAAVVTYIGETLKLKYVARQLAVSVARVVDWQSWAILFTASIVAGVFAHETIERFSGHIQGAFLRSVLGAGIIAAVYSLLVIVTRGSLFSAWFNMVRMRPAP